MSSDAGVATNENFTGTMKIQGVRPRGGAYILTSGADFTGATVNPVDALEWVKRVGVDGSGNVFVEAKPKGFMIIVK